MHNKVLISAFLMVFSLGVLAQEETEELKSDPFERVVQENKIDLYPNPVVTHLTIQISNSSLENVEFELHSIIGNQMNIRVEDLGAGKFKIPLDGFATGYYFLIVMDEQARFKKAYKFLKD